MAPSPHAPCPGFPFPVPPLQKRWTLSDAAGKWLYRGPGVLKSVQGPPREVGACDSHCSHCPPSDSQPRGAGPGGGGSEHPFHVAQSGGSGPSLPLFDLKHLAGAQPEDVSLISAA